MTVYYLDGFDCFSVPSLDDYRKEIVSLIKGRNVIMGGDDEEYEDEDDEEDHGDEDYEFDDRLEFADPGGRSSLRAATPDNPRDQPCPNCELEDVLTRKDVALGYQCDACADAAERGGP